MFKARSFDGMDFSPGRCAPEVNHPIQVVGNNGSAVGRELGNAEHGAPSREGGNFLKRMQVPDINRLLPAVSHSFTIAAASSMVNRLRPPAMNPIRPAGPV